MKTRSTLDDTLDVFPCHGVGGIVGMILTGVFAQDFVAGKKLGLWFGETTTFKYHMIALVIVAVFTFFGSLILYKITDLIIPLRVADDQEHEGLDASQHGEAAWRLNGLLSGHDHSHGLGEMEEVLVTASD